MSEAETATRFSVTATGRSVGGKLADLQDMVCELRDLLMLERATIASSDENNQPWSRNLNAANLAAMDKLKAIEALLDETRGAA
jgi:hypothetical protein